MPEKDLKWWQVGTLRIFLKAELNCGEYWLGINN
jgi:hypothetical protein